MAIDAASEGSRRHGDFGRVSISAPTEADDRPILRPGHAGRKMSLTRLSWLTIAVVASE
jgi:hypothetical protein